MPWASLLLALEILISPGSPAPQQLPVAGQTDLLTDVFALSHAGRRIPAWELLTKQLGERIGAQAWKDPGLAAELEVAALVLTELTGSLGNWFETGAVLQGFHPWPEGVAPGMAFRLDHLLARCLQRQGDVDQARGIIDRLGYFSDLYVVGPFDNERGSGFDVEYEPERVFDRQTPIQGKERLVSWRSNPGRHHPLAQVFLGDILRPREQAVAYLATSLRPRAAGPAVLRIGSTGPYRLFLNGEMVGEGKAERSFAADQDQHVVHFDDGWNSLLIKLGHEEGPWVFAARVTHLDGSPYREVQSERVFSAWPGLPPTDEEAALIFYGVEPEPRFGQESTSDAFEAPAEQRSPLAVPGTRETLEALVAMGDDPWAARLLTLYLLTVQPDDWVDRSAVEAARLAVQADPASVLGHYLLATSFESGHQSRNEVAVNDRLDALAEVLKRDASHVSALLDMASFHLGENPIPSKADAYTARAVEQAPGSWQAHRLRAEFLESRSRSSEADGERRRAEATDEAALRATGQLARARRLTQHGLPDVALATLERAFQRDVMNRALVDELVKRKADTGDFLGALATAERSMVTNPFGLRRMLATAGLMSFGDEVARARGWELLQRMLEVCPEDLGALRALVQVDERRGEAALAAESLREVLRLDPGDTRSRRHLELLTTGEVKRFEDPYRWSAVELAATPMPDKSANDPLEVLRRAVIWRVNPDGTEHRYEHVALRVLNDAGARLLDFYTVAGQGVSGMHVHNARVIHADGSIEPAPPSRGGGRTFRRFDMPPLSAGDVVDVEFRLDQSRADVFGEYFGIRHGFYSEQGDRLAPVRHSELIVLSPAEVPLHIKQHNDEGLAYSLSTDADGLSVHRWVVTDLPRPTFEPAMPRLDEFVPLVDVTTFRDWDEFADWWWHFIEKEFVTTPAMEQKVAELVEGLDEERDKIQAIVRFVGQEIRYNAWAFGTHGYEPYSASTIFERRFGDCKDKSILLRQLLAEIDVEAIPVLIKAESPRTEESLDAALVAMFNHCIAYLPATDSREALYLDATADHNPLDYLRADDQGARVLHVDKDGGDVHDIPFAPAEENALRRSYDVVLDGAGEARVHLVDSSNGAYGVWLRHRFGGEQGMAEDRLAAAMNEAFGTVDVVEFETSDLDDIGEPARLEARFHAVGAWESQGDTRSLRLSFDDIGLDSVATQSDSDRVYEVVLNRPFAHDVSVRYQLPEGARLTELPEDVFIDQPGVLHYTSQARETDGGVEVRTRFSLFEPRVGLDDYPAFRDALARIRQAEDRRIRLSLPAGDQP